MTKHGPTIRSARSAISGAASVAAIDLLPDQRRHGDLELMRNASPGVGRTITQRLRTVLRPPDDHAYEEALVELEIGGMIATRVSPVLLEPLVPEDWRPNEASSPRHPTMGSGCPKVWSPSRSPSGAGRRTQPGSG